MTELPHDVRVRLRESICATPRIRIVQDAVGDFYEVTSEEMIGRSRVHRISWPRQVAMALCYEFDLGSLQLIGKCFGGRDHTTVINARQSVESYTLYPEIHQQIEELRALVKQRLVRHLSTLIQSTNGDVTTK